jgi:pimeloyl-ACP methyl ester carboxylesterase
MKKITNLALAKTIGIYLNLLSYFFPKLSIQKAYFLFSKPRRGKLNNSNLPEILKSAQSEILIVKSEIIQTYCWKGDDKVILLAHGWESNSSRWERLIPELKKTGHTIIALDAPAHGLSSELIFSVPKYAESIAVAVEKFNSEILIGHSMGGKACLYYQYLNQNKNITKMILLGAPCDFSIIYDNYISLLGLNSTIAKGLKTLYFTHFNIDIDQFSGRFFASKITTQGLLVHDIDDTVVLFKESEKLVAQWKTATLITTKGLGHSLHNSDLNKKIIQFIADKNRFGS